MMAKPGETTSRRKRNTSEEARAIDPEWIEKLAEEHLKHMPYKSSGCRYTASSSTSATCASWAGLRRVAKRSHLPFKATIRQDRLAGISASAPQAGLLLPATGQIL